MGQAKRRGTFQERKEKAEKIQEVREQIKADMRKELDSKSTSELIDIANKVGVKSVHPAKKMAVAAALNKAIQNVGIANEQR